MQVSNTVKLNATSKSPPRAGQHCVDSATGTAFSLKPEVTTMSGGGGKISVSGVLGTGAGGHSFTQAVESLAFSISERLDHLAKADRV